MKNDRNRFYLTLSGVTLAHVLLFWAVHNMTNQPITVPPSLDSLNFVLMSSNSIDAERAEASSTPQEAAPKPRPQVTEPEKKIEPKIKPVVKNDAKPDLKPVEKTPEPKPKDPVPQEQPTAQPANTQTASNSSSNSQSTNANASGSSSGSSNSSSNQGSVTQPTHIGGHLNNPQPPYPPQSEEAEEEGSVGLRVRVEANGRASDVQLAKSSGYPRLDRSALRTVRGWRFTPATRGGEPIPYNYTFSVQFKLPRR
ncbi:MAG: energy transducer TonB [Neisseriaceae bacterium]|nr:energy transducer TonB [Neisseriaceae bacterium]